MSRPSNQKVDVKVVLLGKMYGGKTSLVERFINQRFNENIPYQNVSYGHNIIWYGLMRRVQLYSRISYFYLSGLGGGWFL